MIKLRDVSLLKSTSFINGSFLPAGDNQFSVTDPATQELLTNVSNITQQDVLAAVDAAEKALPAWRAKTTAERSAILMKWHDLMLAHQDDLAMIMTREQGKPLSEASREIGYGAAFCDWFANEAKRVYGQTIPAPDATKRILVMKQPVGVTSAITPWNFPSSMITRKAAPALAAGCTFVVKPSELTPLSALALAELAKRAGIPDGVFNVVVGDDADMIGQVLTTHPVIRKFSFTGSTAVGKQLSEQCASTVKRVSLELGGNAPFIVFDDADLDAAVQGAMGSKYRNAGQTCVCANRMFVHASVYDEFISKLSDEVSRLTLGQGTDPNVTTGPMINQQAKQKAVSLIESAVADGAELLVGEANPDMSSNFFQPAILTGVNNQMAVAQTEIFAPLAPVIKFEHEDDVIRMANDTDYGLAAYFYSRDIGRIYRVSEQLEYGMVGVNEGVISNPTAPFGGVKQSGLGREGGSQGIEEYLETRYVCIGI